MRTGQTIKVTDLPGWSRKRTGHCRHMGEATQRAGNALGERTRWARVWWKIIMRLTKGKINLQGIFRQETQNITQQDKVLSVWLCLDICKWPSFTRQTVTDIQGHGEHHHLGNGVLSGINSVQIRVHQGPSEKWRYSKFLMANALAVILDH